MRRFGRGWLKRRCTMASLDLNCDLGEGAGHDEEIMPFITSANIACGAHAGNAVTMRRIAVLAESHGVAVGAHPGYPDREGFGRRELGLGVDEVAALVKAQIKDLQRIAAVRHVKLHGSLYSRAARNREVARAVAGVVRDCGSHLILFALSGSVQVEEGEAVGLRVAQEVFADRTYQADGSLTQRSKPGAVIEGENEAVAQALAFARAGTVRSVEGKIVSVRADTLCLHGDGRNAPAFARRIRQALAAAGVRPAPVFSSVGDSLRDTRETR